MRGLKWLVAMASVSLVIGVGAVSTDTASATQVDRCGESIDSRPVVLPVHGFNGRPGIWGEQGQDGSMNDSIAVVAGVKLAAAFDYRSYNIKWVTDEHIGPALAAKINCLSDASLEVGGDGKIIVIAHSMGGLALREALNQNAAVHTDPSKIGLTITIGTPHKGTDLGYFGSSISLCLPSMGSLGYSCLTAPAISAMRPGSPELAVLPKLPGTVPVRAIAGKVIGYTGSSGDDVVSVASATNEFTTAYPGDGQFVVSCYRVLPWQSPSCAHGNLLKDAGVQASVIQALGEYVNSPPPTCPPIPSEPEGEIGGTGTMPTPCP